ncbi:MAG: NHL repeat-containing protein [Ferrimicrobium sp.]
MSTRPAVWLGSPPKGGLMLPDAMPSARSLYAPRGVWTDGVSLVVADTGNHRVLIWNEVPTSDHSPADVVLGQPDFLSEGPSKGGPAWGLNLPTGVLVDEGRLVVADAWNHRVLVWEQVPSSNYQAPTYALGQSDLESCLVNAGGACSPTSLNWPFGIGFGGSRFWVADTGNHRVLGWEALPEPGDKVSVILGQADGFSNEDNRGEIGAASFRWVHDVAGGSESIYFADAGNHRVLVWPSDVDSDVEAVAAVGQKDLCTSYEWAYGPQSREVLRFPYAVSCESEHLAIADTANNRVLLYNTPPTATGAVADAVCGQDDFSSFGENRWKAVTHDSMCWPYGICLSGDLLAVADSGNNRVVLWRVEFPP